MGLGDHATVTNEAWYYRGVAAQIDEWGSWSNYIYAVTALGGTPEEVIAIALDAAATEAYDTSAPWHLWRGLKTLSADGYPLHQLLVMPDIQTSLLATIDGYLAAEDRFHSEHYMRSMKIIVAYLSGDFAGAFATWSDLTATLHADAAQELPFTETACWVQCELLHDANDYWTEQVYHFFGLSDNEADIKFSLLKDFCNYPICQSKPVIGLLQPEIASN